MVPGAFFHFASSLVGGAYNAQPNYYDAFLQVGRNIVSIIKGNTARCAGAASEWFHGEHSCVMYAS
jgi:hypothetical protein